MVQDLKCPKCGAVDNLWKDTNQPGQYEKDLANWKCYFCECDRNGISPYSQPIEFIDETNEIIEKCKELEDDLEPLDNRKKRLVQDKEFEKEKGRPSKRIRTEDSSMQ